MKKLTLLVLVVMLLSVALVACGEDHTHTFSADWSKNDTQHWNAATCEHSSEVDNKADHVDINNDKICDVCAYDYNHEHAYSADWTYDAENHWNAASCGCTIAPKNVAAHADADNDGACDVCGHIASLSHTFAADWSTDAENHWKAALCGHDVVAEKAAHTLDAYGICSVCAYNAGTVDVTTLTLEEAIALGLARADVVVNGKYTETINTDSRKYTNKVVYKFGEGFFYVSSQIDQESLNYRGEWVRSENDTNIWYYAINDGVWSIVEDKNGKLSVNTDEVTLDNLLGVQFDGSNVGYVVEKQCGIEAYIAAIYAYAAELETFTSNGHSFSFVNGEGEDAITYTVTFTLDADNYFVKSAEIKDSTGAKLVLTQSNVWTDDANAPEFVGAKAFDLVYTTTDENGEEVKTIVGDSFEFVRGSASSLIFTVEGISPEYANMALDEIKFYVDGECTTMADWGGFSAGNNRVVFYFYQAGEFEVTLKSLFVEKTLTFTVVNPPVSTIAPTVDETEATESTVYVGQDVVIGAVVNQYADASFTAAITDGDAEKATLTLDELTGAYVFNATEAGTWTVTITSAENAEITATLVLTVNELTEVDVDTFFNTVYTGKDEWDWAEMKVVFAPDMLDATIGTVEITITTSWNADSFTYNYTYDEEARIITLTWDGEWDMLGVTLVVNGDATLSAYQMGTKFALAPGGDDEEINSMFFNGKTYTFTDKDGKVWYLRFTYYEPAYEGAPERYYLLLCDAVSGRYQNGWGYDYEYKEINIPGRPVMPAITFVYDGNGVGTVPELYNLVYDALNDTIAVTDAYVTDNAADPYVATRYEGAVGGR